MKIKYIESSTMFAIHNNLIERYYGENIIFHRFKLDGFEDKDLLYCRMIEKGFNKFSGSFVNGKRLFIDATRELFIKKINEGIVCFNKEIDSSDISYFYETHISIEIRGKRISSFYRSPDNESVYFQYSDDEYPYDHPYLSEIFGKRVPDGHEPRVTSFLVPVDKIDKFIATKRYKDCSWIGSDRETEFTGETEEIVLDMHNFDEKAYQFFLDHDIIKLER